MSLILLALFLLAGTSRAQPLDLNKEYLRLQSEMESHPDDPGLKMDLAYVFSQGRELQRAIALYEEVIRGDAKNLRAMTELCALYAQAREENKAESACRAAADLAPNDPLLSDNLGLFYFQFGRFRESLEPFLRAMSLDPAATLSRTHLAQAFLALKAPAAAREQYERVLHDKNAGIEERALSWYGLYLVARAERNADDAFTAIRETYKLSGNPLYLGKVVGAFLTRYEAVSFVCVGAILLMVVGYLGKRLNRFLKNEDNYSAR